MFKLKRRIKSLEEVLGLAYKPKEGREDYDDHIDDRACGRLRRIENRLERLEDKVLKDEK